MNSWVKILVLTGVCLFFLLAGIEILLTILTEGDY